MTAIQEQVHKRLISLAQQHPKIQAIYRGYNIEDRKHKIYYLLVPGKFDEDLENTIADVDIKLAEDFPKENLDLMIWPIPNEQAQEYEFLEKCIWQR